ncbi:MAG: CocE/NonD family hydrolase [Clostridiales bacterium]|nr:CocE/NonD family hydrolase [Clostridiales bacterium]
MLRGIKRVNMKFPKGEQEVVYVQTPEQALRCPPDPEKEQVVDTEQDVGPFGPTMAYVEKMPVAPIEPKTYLYDEGVLCDQDVTITLSDGTVFYADIYRPDNDEKVPVILCWSLYGKQQITTMPSVDGEWNVCAVPEGAISKFTKFEAADPAYWCRVGYAICNIDTRGAFNSEGDMNMWNTQEAEDAAEIIEYLAIKCEWSNGKVALFGNSFLGISQWCIASKNPKYLTCIAPWNASSDVYRDLACIGGIPDGVTCGVVSYKSLGHNYIEDPRTMLDESPYINCPYWQDKFFDVENINIPVYAVAGWSVIHLRGTVRAFEALKTPNKWIRFHRCWEWGDDYQPEHLEDLKRFFDRYLKGIRNGWEYTPTVRLDVTDAYEYDYQKGRPELAFPLPRTKYTKLYLDADKMEMQKDPVEAASKVIYDANREKIHFDYVFPEETELTGHTKLKLWVEADGYNNMDLFVVMEKLSSDGETIGLSYVNDRSSFGSTNPMKMNVWSPAKGLDAMYPGPMGRMRVSRRKLDENLSTDYFPVQANDCDEYLKPGEVVPVEIEIWPISRIWHKGQTLRITICGVYDRGENWTFAEFPQYTNKGNHIIHTGGQYDSYLQVPVIPPRYKDGDYVYR